MNCQTIQHRILGLADPADLTGSLAEHVSECPSCQAWHHLLVQMEIAIAGMPVLPDSGRAKAQLLSQFKPEPAKPKTKQTTKEVAPPKPVPAISVRPRQPFGDRIARLWPAGAVAVVACVGVVLWSFVGKKTPVEMASHTPDPMLDRVVAAKVQLDVAKTAPDRLKVLAKLADDVQDQARSLYLVAPGDEMASLSKMYNDIVAEGLVFQAEVLGDNEKRQLLGEYTDRLAKTEQQAERLAAEAPVGSDEPLREIARTARNGKNQLAKLREKSL
ncbi:lipase chaperone [Zavarzinella formosa]|uniref:lipase chaperone n=1 Tax=Zavarzinella formosa TaxID=360055 RepID=UPI000305A19D|nr:lipase chaperone [Zavarzinella formosa]